MSEFPTNPEALSSREVGIGSIVTLHFLDEPDDPVETILIVSDHSRQAEYSHPPITTSSPVGRAILGAKPGDIKEFSVPGYPISRVRIMSVKNNL